MEPQHEEALKKYFLDAFKGYSGIMFSGGTQHLNEDDSRQFMITEIPVLIAAANPGVKTLATFPRTGQMTLVNLHAELSLDEGGNQPDARYDELTLVQQGPNELLGWDGDLDTYFELMGIWKELGANQAVLTYNGGGVTYKEAKRAYEFEYPLIIIDGSGRKSDELAIELADKENVYIVKAGDTQALRFVLETLGFVS